MHPPHVKRQALDLIAAGHNDCEVSRRLRIPRGTIRDWRTYVPKRRYAIETCPRCWRAAKPMRFTPEDYSELLRSTSVTAASQPIRVRSGSGLHWTRNTRGSSMKHEACWSDASHTTTSTRCSRSGASIYPCIRRTSPASFRSTDPAGSTIDPSFSSPGSASTSRRLRGHSSEAASEPTVVASSIGPMFIVPCRTSIGAMSSQISRKTSSICSSVPANASASLRGST
jgi:hypothetical protein